MRVLTGAILVTAMILASFAASAQTYDPRYPVCAEVATIDGSFISCGYGSLAQCQASASGRGARCFANPYFAQGDKKAARRVNH